MANFQPLSEVGSARGAPMGRRDHHADDQDAPIKLIVHHLPFVDGDYDAGGAYWGAGEPLWRAVEPEGDVEFFLRAKDRWEALAIVRGEYPSVEIVDTPREAWFEDFVLAYEVAALWSSTDEDGESLDMHELAPDTKVGIRLECQEFCDFAEQLLLEAFKRDYSATQAGHDYWLTRCGHGAGFWDRGLGDLGDKLTQAAKSDGSRDLYLGDDNLVYQS